MPFEELLMRLVSAIEADTPDTEIIERKQDEALLLHDLELDLNLFENIVIYELFDTLDTSVARELVIDMRAIRPYLPKRIGLLDRLFGRVASKYFTRFEPLSIRRAAELMYMGKTRA